jgi:formylglycine-generating enzyme required for sulfatase activity
MRSRILAGLALLLIPTQAAPPSWMHVTIEGRSAENSTYLEASFFYQLQTLVGTEASSPKVLDSAIVRRQRKELYIDLNAVAPAKAALLRNIAGKTSPVNITLGEIAAYMDRHYYELTRPYPNLKALLAKHPYRDNPNWLTVPVDSATFHHRRVLHIQKDRIADALMSYFDNKLRLIYPQGTVIAADSFDPKGNFIETEVLRKRGDTFWNFAVYDRDGALIRTSIAFDERGEVAHDLPGFHVPGSCANCHRIDRLDFSGDPQPPISAPVPGFFHRLPAHTPEIHLGPEYYDHKAFRELTEATSRQKDGVFGVYGSLFLSELVIRKRLGRLTEDDRARYQRLLPDYSDLLEALDHVDSFTNSIGVQFIRIPAPVQRVMIGSLDADPEHRPDEQRHPLRYRGTFFLDMRQVTNAEFRRFRPTHRSGSYQGKVLDGDDQPVANLNYDDAQAFVAWLNQLPEERAAGRIYRLPNEEEWEYAAQGGDGRRFAWGDEWPPPGSAKQFPNPFFLYGLTGSTREWTGSIYGPYPEGRASEAPNGSTLRVVRGSSWADESQRTLRIAYRIPTPPEERSPFVGLRVAADVPSLH